MSYRIASLFVVAAALTGPTTIASLPVDDSLAVATPDTGLGDALADELNALRIAGQGDVVVERLENDPLVTERKDPRALAVLALAQINIGRGPDADLLLAGVSRPYLGKSWEMMLALGTLFIDAGQSHRAVPTLKRARNFAPDNAEVEFALLRAQAYQNESNAAIDALIAFDRAEEVPPDTVDRQVGNAVYAHAVRLMDKDADDDRALDLLRTAAKLLPKDPAIAVTIARVLTLRGLTGEADVAIRYIEDNFEARMEEALYLRAVQAEQAGDPEEAFRLATDAIHLSGRNHIEALALAGRIGQDIGRYYEARKHLDRLLALSAKHFVGRYQLARYNVQRAKDTDQAGDVGHYLREAEKNCLHAKVASPHNVANLELLESVYMELESRGNKNVDLKGVRRDLVVARMVAARNAKLKNGG